GIHVVFVTERLYFPHFRWTSVSRWSPEKRRNGEDADGSRSQDKLVRILAITCNLACNPCSIVTQRVKCVFRWDKASLNFNNRNPFSFFRVNVADQNFGQLLLYVNGISVADQVLCANQFHDRVVNFYQVSLVELDQPISHKVNP